MSDRKLYRLVHATARAMAVAHVSAAPEGYMVEIKPPTRSLEQNAKLHSLLQEISEQVVWYGQKLCAEDWKRILAAALQKVRVVPGLTPGEYVPVGLRTRDMTIPEMSDMIELALSFGAEQGVVFKEAVVQMGAGRHRGAVRQRARGDGNRENTDVFTGDRK